jgi:hypothetical protein
VQENDRWTGPRVNVTELTAVMLKLFQCVIHGLVVYLKSFPVHT